MSVLKQSDLVSDLQRLGVPEGGLLMVHSSLRSIGQVEGGADTVVEALLEALGPPGTLVVPTFSDEIAARYNGFVFDVANTPSYVGAITEAARTRPDARRSHHPWHSVAAIGPFAPTLISEECDSAWRPGSPMSQIVDRGLILLLGVPYQRLTLAHWCEFHLEVPYRPEIMIQVPIRREDGSIVTIIDRECPPDPGTPARDYNRLGMAMEAKSLVKIGAVGNAVGRLFHGRDARDTAVELYRDDEQAFLVQGEEYTALTEGHTVETSKGTLCVYDPELI
jgi:aminoglycoside 3-N-acetyltransferase